MTQADIKVDDPSKAAGQNGCTCRICGYHTEHPSASEVGAAVGNTARFKNQHFRLWKCPKCLSIHNMDAVDFADIYRDYALNKRRLDVFARGTLKNLLLRLTEAGLQKQHSILDYGCGTGIFMEFLEEEGYHDVAGYDPFVEKYKHLPTREFDCVVANDVLEHVPDPRAMVAECAKLVKPGGLLYLGTADSEPVDMKDLTPHIMRLHQPFHRVIITQQSLLRLAEETGFTLIKSYRRSYMDTLRPFSNYRFLDEFNKALGHDMDLAFDPEAGKVVFRHPSLFFYAFFGYWFPSAFEPAVVLRKPA